MGLRGGIGRTRNFRVSWIYAAAHGCGNIAAMDEAHDIRAFVEVARSGSFLRAAAILGQTKSALSKAVARLEDRLGVRLVTRTTRHLSLTDEGRSFLADCERILGELEAAGDRVRRHRGAPSGALRVELPLLWGREQIVPLLPSFRRIYPDIHLRVLFADSRLPRLDDAVDLRVRVGESSEAEYVSKPLLSTRAIVVGAPSYLAHAGTPPSPDALARHTCVHYMHPTTLAAYPWYFRRGGAVFSRVYETPLMLSFPEAMRDAAIAGLGLVQGPDFLFSEAIARGRLTQVLEEYAAAGPTICIVWRHNRYLPQRVRVFIDWMCEAVKS